jgi:hypothetical protein
MECSCEVGQETDPRCAERGMCGRTMTAPDHLSTARPDWGRVYRGVAHTPDRDNDLIPVTRETLRLAMHALQKQNGEDYYHNYGAAERELYAVLGATATRDESHG